jgi:hypothetical protein
MDPGAAFFFEILAFQFVLTAAVIALVARRFPRRLAAYRFIVPAAVPLMMLVLALVSYGAVMEAQGARPEGMVIVRLVLAYAVLWLAGVLLASMVIRWVRRR